MAYAKIKMEKLQELQSKAQDFDKVMEDVMNECIKRLAIAAIGYAKHNTAVKTGLLRGAYFYSAISKKGDVYNITLHNNTEYASYYEFGHSNPKGWTEGRFPLTKGVTHAEENFGKIVDRIVEKKLKELFDGE